MTRTRTSSSRILVGLTVAAAGMIALGATAFAGPHGPGHGPGFGHGRRAAQHLDKVLDVAGVSPAQRAAMHQIGERAALGLMSHRGEPGLMMERALTLFEADRIDDGVVANMRAEQQARVREVGDLAVVAVREAHGALTTPQRQAIVAYVQGQMAARAARHAAWMEEHGHEGDAVRGGMHRGMRGPMGGPMMQRRFEHLIAVAAPTPEQRRVIDAAHARVKAAVEVAGRDRTQLGARALALFAADRWDDDAVARFRLEQEAKIERVADVMMGAVREVHDVLTPAQRKAVVDAVRAHRAEMRRRFEERGGRAGHHGHFAPQAPQD